ncbi:MAG: lamin tail domain-containing protein [Woeseiaceae bacterium]
MPRNPSRLRAMFVFFLACAFANPASAQVFINEIHYDNTGTDAGEAIEIAGPAGTDLTGWSIVLYNGNGGASYGSDALSGVLVNQQGGFGTLVVDYPSNGLQNGAPDGIALVDNTNTVIQFLSYEGSFTAVGGPADGLTSTDIGVAESSGTPVGDSLQLTGSGTQYADFAWAASQPSTFCAINTGQTFGDGSDGGEDPCGDPGGGDPSDVTLVINEIDYDQPSTDAAEFIELKNVGAADVDLTGVTVVLVNGNGDSVYNTFALPAETLAPGDYFVICANPANTPGCDLDVSPNTNLVQNGAPDAVAIMSGATQIDGVSYEGDVPSVVEVSGAGLADSGSTPFVSISRFPDGVDTDQNNVDLSLRCTTPGKPNSADSANCPDPLPPLIVNELQADPDASLGDANGDGVTNTSQDEFVEIVNISGAAIDISGWTLSDAVAVRHTFAAGSVIGAQCSMVVFGGGTHGQFWRHRSSGRVRWIPRA